MSLGPDARALLDAAEGGDEPSAADAARVRRRLAAHLALGAAAGTAAATVTKSAPAAAGAGTAGAAGAAGAAVPMTSMLSAKVLVALALVGGATATGAVVMHERAPAPVVSAVAASASAAPHSDTREHVGAPGQHEESNDPTAGADAPSAPPAPATDATTRGSAKSAGKASAAGAGADTTDEGAQIPNRGRTANATATHESAAAKSPGTVASRTVDSRANNITAPRAAGTRSGGNASAVGDANAVSGRAASGDVGGRGVNGQSGAEAESAGAGGPAPARPVRDTVAEEAGLLRAANAALARGDGATALARVDEHASRFPRGALAEEREAARVLGLCAAGRVAESRAAATKFVAASPRSPFIAQVRRACTPP